MIDRVDDLRILQELHEALAGHYKHNVCEQVAQRITVAARDPELVGGATGVLAWDWFELEVLWVTPRRRQQGLGGALLSRVEQEAAASGAQSVSLRCVSDATAAFYLHRGYSSAGRVPDFPPGFAMHWLFKSLIGS
jgi:GNAT superfamily N-acetyltransferase